MLKTNLIWVTDVFRYDETRHRWTESFIEGEPMDDILEDDIIGLYRLDYEHVD